MPHDKTGGEGGVVLDHQGALTITTVGKLDSCRSGNPLKIPKRGVSGEDGCSDVDVAKCARKCPKIHWTQIASNGRTSQTSCHNGSQTANHDHNDVANMENDRRQVKVILTDVLQTEEGRRYLSSCSGDSKTMCQPDTPTRGARWRRNNRRMSAVHRNSRRASLAHREQISASKDTDSSSAEEPDIQPSKNNKSPVSKKHKKSGNSLKHTELSTFYENESCSHDKTVSPQSEQIHIPVAKPTEHELCDTDNNVLCPIVESDTLRSTSASPLHSKGSSVLDDQHPTSQEISECIVTATRRHTSSLSLSRNCHTKEHLGRDVHSTQLNCHKASVRETDQTADVREDKGENDEEEVVAVQHNGEVMEEGGGSRESVLRLSIGAAGDQLEMGVADGECRAQPQSSDLELSKVSNPHAPEPIVLSSEEEEEEEEDSSKLLVKTLEGVKDPHTPQRLTPAVERKKISEPYTLASEMHDQAPSIMASVFSSSTEIEFQFSALYMGGISAVCKGLVKITHDKVTISLKDPTGTEVKTSLATAHIQKYSIWDECAIKDSGLVKQNGTPPPSLILLFLSEDQAKHTYSDLSVIQPGTCPADGSMCLLLCVCEPLKGIEGALLASIMDIVSLGNGTISLLSSLSHAESMELLQSSKDTHLLQLLSPQTDTHATSDESETTPESVGSATSVVTEPDVQGNSVYTLCHRRAQDSFSVFVVPKPGPEWTPYRHRGPARRLIQFPPPPCKGAITVTTEDLECLESGEFLNDVIIDFYLKYLLVQKAPQASVKRSHVFSSFFYKQLTRRDNANEDSSSTPAQLRRHQRVRTWTRHVDIFEKDFLFVPVNQEAHWYLVVVCFPGMDEQQLVEREDQGSVQDGTENSSDSVAGSEPQESSRHNSNGDKSSDENSSKSTPPAPPNCTEKTCKRKTVCKRPCIIIMDSLKLSVHERIFKLLREYLQVEWKVKRGGQRDFSAERMVGSHCKVPLQDNSSDCGLYLLQYAESFLQDPVVHFDLPLRLECWFPRQQVREKREEIRDLVLHLYRFQPGALGHEGSEGKTDMGNVVQ